MSAPIIQAAFAYLIPWKLLLQLIARANKYLSHQHWIFTSISGNCRNSGLYSGGAYISEGIIIIINQKLSKLYYYSSGHYGTWQYSPATVKAINSELIIQGVPVCLCVSLCWCIWARTVVSLALTWVMGQRYLATSKFMPAGLVAGLRSVFPWITHLLCLACFWGFQQNIILCFIREHEWWRR
jgi:hypothetical protein